MPDQSSVEIKFRGTVEYRTELQMEGLKRGLKVQALLERAVERYLAGPKCLTATESRPEHISGYAKENKEAHNLLEEILSSGTPEQANLISGNLQIFVEATRASADKQQRKRKTG